MEIFVMNRLKHLEQDIRYSKMRARTRTYNSDFAEEN